MGDFEIQLTEDGKIPDFLTDQPLEPKPEEFVRQRFLRILHFEYGYPKNIMRREVPIWYGSKELVDTHGRPVRADIVVYESPTACANRDQGKISLVVECKAPGQSEGYNQLVSYIFNTSADGGVWYNGTDAAEEVGYYRRESRPHNRLIPWIGIPRYGTTWDSLGRRKKSELYKPQDIKGLLRRCHNKLHGRGNEGEEEDLTMDMVRIILAKAMDEEQEGDLPEFYCTPEEYRDENGRAAVEARLQHLFDEVKQLNAQVFSPTERISVGARAICDVVIEIQPFQLLTDPSSSQDWDVMGYAYEEYTATYLKRRRGQFFTNRLIIDFLVAALDPNPTDIVLDPAGGSGGFLTSTLRYVRRKILTGQANLIAQRRQLDRFRTRLFMIDISKRLVKVAKTAMILNGDGHRGMYQGDSLSPYQKLDTALQTQVGRRVPTVILTNPPFAGVGAGRVTDQDTLEQFAVGKRWVRDEFGYHATAEFLPEGAPPELLFFERCLDWLAPGGKLGIVLPKSFLDTTTYLAARTLLFTQAQLLAVVNCHPNTFQPHTGVRTCLVLVRKLDVGEAPPDDYSIFMAISRKIGQDSEGAPIFKRDNANKILPEIDHDLDEILAAYRDFGAGNLHSSEYRFAARRRELDEFLRINPQLFLPSYNETLRQVAAMDGVNRWSVVSLGQLTPDIEIFKGPRLKSENIQVEGPGKPGVEPYYTPSALLQEKSDSVKWWDLTRANPAQLRAIAAIRVHRGDILITRSGSIGRLVYVTRQYDNAIVSDDLIRVRIADETLRYYVYLFLQTKYAQDQMLRNEYGAIQQHLEPEHVRNILIPITDDLSQLEIVENTRKIIALKEELYAASESTLLAINATLGTLAGSRAGENASAQTTTDLSPDVLSDTSE